MSRIKGELEKLSKEISKDNKMILLRGYTKEVTNYRTKEGRADIIVDVNLPPYDSLLRQSINMMNQIKRETLKALAQKYDVDLSLVEEQKDSVVQSLEKSLDKFNKDTDEKDNKYDYFGNGIKMRKEDEVIYITGKKVEERTIIKEEYKPKRSRVTTLIKDEFRGNLPNKMSVYKIDPRSFYKIKAVG